MELKALRGELRRALKDVHLPRPTHFKVSGQEYKLPYGCVRSDLSGLAVGQSVQGAEVLFLFCMLLGAQLECRALAVAQLVPSCNGK